MTKQRNLSAFDQNADEQCPLTVYVHSASACKIAASAVGTKEVELWPASSSDHLIDWAWFQYVWTTLEGVKPPDLFFFCLCNIQLGSELSFSTARIVFLNCKMQRKAVSTKRWVVAPCCLIENCCLELWERWYGNNSHWFDNLSMPHFSVAWQNNWSRKDCLQTWQIAELSAPCALNLITVMVLEREFIWPHALLLPHQLSPPPTPTHLVHLSAIRSGVHPNCI